MVIFLFFYHNIFFMSNKDYNFAFVVKFIYFYLNTYYYNLLEKDKPLKQDLSFNLLCYLIQA